MADWKTDNRRVVESESVRLYETRAERWWICFWEWTHCLPKWFVGIKQLVLPFGRQLAKIRVLGLWPRNVAYSTGESRNPSSESKHCSVASFINRRSWGSSAEYVSGPAARWWVKQAIIPPTSRTERSDASRGEQISHYTGRGGNMTINACNVEVAEGTCCITRHGTTVNRVSRIL